MSDYHGPPAPPGTPRCIACGIRWPMGMLCQSCHEASEEREVVGRANWKTWETKPMAEQTYWNGEPAPCRRVLVKVGKAMNPTWWCAGLEGTTRKAVEVNYYGDVFYLDDDDLPDDQEEREGAALADLPRGQRRRIERLKEAAAEMFGEPHQPEAGDGWRKVTIGRGSPQYSHRSLPVEEVVEVL